MNGAAVKSCTVLAVQADGASIATIEGLASNGDLHAMQQAFTEKHGLQCGFCTSGMIMTAVKLVESLPDIEEDDIRHGLEGNLCRCTGYENVVRAVAEAARQFDPKNPWEMEPAEYDITLRAAERRDRSRT
jgi:carbon-monoxide dehydrogenase small subunit